LWRHGGGAGLGSARRRHGLRAQSAADRRALPSRAGRGRQRRWLFGRPGPQDQAQAPGAGRRGSSPGPTTSIEGTRIGVLITRPEREATALATALGQRGHVAVIAPLFRLDFLHPPVDFAAALGACQAVLLTSANGARALAEASEQRSKPVFAVGDTTAATAEGLGFTNVTSAAGDGAALAELVRQRLDPKAGPLVHVSGVDVAGETSAE